MNKWGKNRKLKIHHMGKFNLKQTNTWIHSFDSLPFQLTYYQGL